MMYAKCFGSWFKSQLEYESGSNSNQAAKSYQAY